MQAPKMGWQELFDQLNGGGRGGGSGSSGSGGSGGSGSGSGSGGGTTGSGGGAHWTQSTEQMSERSRRFFRRLWKVLVVLLIPLILLCYWGFHPPINIQSADCWFFVGFFILFPLFLLFYIRSQIYKVGTKKHPKNAGKAKLNKRLMLIPVAIVVVGLLGSLASAVFFPGNAERYSSILSIEELDFTSDIQQVNYEEIPVIDRSSAVILGNRVMGGIPEYVSQFEISPLYSQINYQGHPVRVSPLLYADIIKWFTNSGEGLPAYVKVDMTTQDTEIVRLEQAMRYSESEVLDRNISRHIQLSYPFYLFDEFSFEIDDEGRPWWICPVQQRTIGLFGGTTIQRVIMCDAVSGETQDIPIEEVPQWVDRAYPSDLLIEQYNWYGAYHNGWLNSFLGQEGVVQTTPGTDGMIGYNYIAKDDDVWVYSGVTSAVSDNSIVGFMLINQRTAEGHYYAIAGATEDSAMNSAEGQVQHLHYNATFPILINISDVPTYFMALKDAAGLVKMYAMLDIQRYQNVGVGDTLAGTEQAYKALLITNGIELEGEEELALNYEEASGVVARIATAVIEGNSHFYLVLEGDTNIYDCALPALFQVLQLDPGQEVTLRYWQDGDIRVVEELKIQGSESSSGTSSSSGTAGAGGSEAESGGGSSGSTGGGGGSGSGTESG
jgi:uncharacterized membrane protein YgcG